MNLKAVNLLNPALHPQDDLMEKMLCLTRKPQVGDDITIPLLKALMEWFCQAPKSQCPSSAAERILFACCSLAFGVILYEMIAPWKTSYMSLKYCAGITCGLASAASALTCFQKYRQEAKPLNITATKPSLDVTTNIKKVS